MNQPDASLCYGISTEMRAEKERLQMAQPDIETERQWKAIYKTAGALALLIALAGMVDALTSNMGIGARENSSIGITEWFALFQANRFSAFSCLGAINMLTLSLAVPIYLALYHTHRQSHPTTAALASILFFVGTAVYLSSNTVFPLFALSEQYAAASAAQKPLLEAAGRALLAQGADLTTGTFMGLLMTQTAGLLITGAMLRGSGFGKWTGGIGLVGFGLTTVFFFLAAFAPENFGAAMLFAMPGGLLLTAYQILLARRFFQLGR